MEEIRKSFTDVRMVHRILIGCCTCCRSNDVDIVQHIEFECVPARPVVAPPPQEAPDAVFVKGKYKIHGLRTANGEVVTSETKRFYDDYKSVIKQAEVYVNSPNSSRRQDSMVIYQAIEVVQPVCVPTVVRPVK